MTSITRQPRFKVGQKLRYSPAMISVFKERPIWRVDYVDVGNQKYHIVAIVDYKTRKKWLPFRLQSHYRVEGLRFEDQPK